MKRLLFSIIALSSFSVLNAQEFKFGAKAGLNFSTISEEVPQINFDGIQVDDEPPKNSFDIGYHLGGFAELLVSNKFSVQAELLYSRQGSKLESNTVKTKNYSTLNIVSSSSTKRELKTSYFNIPILAKYYINEKFFVVAGPQFGLLLSATSSSTGISTRVSTTASNSTFTSKDYYSPETDTKSSFNSLNIALGLGGGYLITKNIFAEARYNFGLTNDGKSITLPILGTIESKVKTSAIQVSLGYKF